MKRANTNGRKSGLWELVAPSMADAAERIERFRAPGGANSRLAHWEPRESTLRWFRSYLQVAAQNMSPSDLEVLTHIQNMSIGDPVTVTIDAPPSGEPLELSLDYVFAAEELGFLRRALPVSMNFEPAVVVELGAGFGRTAHVFLTVLPSIETYVVVDLPETLSLSRAYLRAALPSRLWSKLVFIDARMLEGGIAPYIDHIDLALQIDGFQEMAQSSIDNYYTNLMCHAQLVFLSNPVGKYLPETAGILDVDPAIFSEVSRLGRCCALVDPWDSRDLAHVRQDYIEAYRPSGFDIVASEPSRLRPFYQHVLYRAGH